MFKNDHYEEAIWGKCPPQILKSRIFGDFRIEIPFVGSFLRLDHLVKDGFLNLKFRVVTPHQKIRPGFLSAPDKSKTFISV